MLPTIVKIDYGILKDNFIALQNRFSEVSLSPVVKADAYGHGLLETSLTFIDGGAERLCVFRLEEAEQLRKAGISVPIWVLCGALPVEAEQAAAMENVTFGVFSTEQLNALSAAGIRAGKNINVHLAVDTGMSRLGFMPEEAIGIIPELCRTNGISLKGIYSHIAKADEPDSDWTKRQTAGFRKVLAALPSGCTENHLCASNAIVNSIAPELSYARPGICLYAETVLPGDTGPITHDAMSLESEIISLKTIPAGTAVSYGGIRVLERDSIVAVIPVGYEDGLLRSLSDRMEVLIHGIRAKQLGRICMSMIMVDVTDIPCAAVGDRTVILGSQGNDKITVNELTAIAGTTQHEFLCAIGKHRIESNSASGN